MTTVLTLDTWEKDVKEGWMRFLFKASANIYSVSLNGAIVPGWRCGKVMLKDALEKIILKGGCKEGGMREGDPTPRCYATMLHLSWSEEVISAPSYPHDANSIKSASNQTGRRLQRRRAARWEDAILISRRRRKKRGSYIIALTVNTFDVPVGQIHGD